jgi:hypothetical protein
MNDSGKDKIYAARTDIAAQFAALATQLSITLDLPTAEEILLADRNRDSDYMNLTILKYLGAIADIATALELRERAS